MDPAVVAAWIAAGASGLTLVTTVAVQSLNQRASLKNAEATAAKALIKQQEQLDQTFAEQRDQLDRTLAEQSQQLDRTLTEQRFRTLNERFGAAAEQLGSDKPAVRLAGVYAMAGLADDWEENRQTCVDVLCAYLRMPYEAEPGQDTPEPQRLAFLANREVRHTVIRVITAHLRDGAAVSWQHLDLDFTSVVFDGGDFSFARFSGFIDFSYAQFCGGEVSFDMAKFSDATVLLRHAQFSGGEVHFTNLEFDGATVVFNGAEFSGGTIKFVGTEFSDGSIFAFGYTEFSGGNVDFYHARFSGGRVHFTGANFWGSTVSFDHAEFSSGKVDFSEVSSWQVQPKFPWTGTPPSGVKLPSSGGGTANPESI